MTYLRNAWYMAAWDHELGTAIADFAASMDPTTRVTGQGYLKVEANLHVFTPETATTTHCLFGTSCPLRKGEEAVQRAAADIEFLRTPFAEEDRPMLEAQQRAMADAEFCSLKPVLLSGDAAAVRARHVLDGLIKAEQETASA